MRGFVAIVVGSLLSEGSAQVVQLGGDAAVSEPPASILLNEWESDDEIRVWSELSGTLSSQLNLGHVRPGLVKLQEQLVGGTVGAGTSVQSFMIRMDPVGDGPAQLSGHVVFSTRIFGVYIGSQLNPTDAALGRVGVSYNKNSYRGLELEPAATSIDQFEISADRHRIDFVMEVGEWTDDIRVVTSATDCEADCDLSGSLDFFDFLCFQNEFAGGHVYADCDNSGSLDFFDFLCFQNEFSLGTAYADCDMSGSHDFFDFLCFQNEFSEGCP